jgi:hypothetical protein
MGKARNLFWPGHIAGQSETTLTLVLNVLNHLLRARRFIAVRDGDIIAMLGERFCGCRADATRGSSDKSHTTRG